MSSVADQTSEGEPQETTEPGYLDKVATPDENADSSSAEDAKGPKSVLDAIQAVMKDKGEGEPSSTEGEAEGEDEAKPAPDSKESVPDEKPAEPKAETEDKPPPFHNHPRWKALIRERDELRAKITGAEDDLKVAQGLRQYVSQNGLSNQEVADGLKIMALMKQDPEAALEAMRPHLERLMQATGSILPEDLQAKVEEGEISEELAQELAQSRLRQQSITAQAEKAKQVAVSTQVQQVSDAVQRWTDSWRQSDPDASVKLPRVLDKVRLRFLQGELPSDSNAAIAMCDRVLDEVTKEIEMLRPKREARRPIAGGGGAPSRATPKPKSMLEVVQQAAGGVI